MNYTINLNYDSGDKIWIANVPDLDGCYAHGETPEDALREIKVAQELWIECALKDGETLPEPSKQAG